MSVSKRLRYEILRRDDHACRYCGARAPEVKLTVDHVIPVTLGGSDDPGNLVAACRDCNAGKSSVPADAALVDNVAADAIRWGQAMSVVAAHREREFAAMDNALRSFLSAWSRWGFGDAGNPYPLPDDFPQTIRQFYVNGLDSEFLARAADDALTRGGTSRGRVTDRFRYFCGICWREIEQRQEMARARLTLEETHEHP